MKRFLLILALLVSIPTLVFGAEAFNSYTNTGDLQAVDEFAFYRTGTGMRNYTPSKLLIDSSSLTDPAADRILFWDDSADAYAFLTVGSGLSLSGTTLTSTATGDVAGQSSSVDNEVALFSGTGGKTIKRATTTGIAKLTSGVLSAATAGTDYYNPGGTDVAVADGGTNLSSYTTGDLLYASGSAALSKLAAVGTGNALISGGTSTAPSWGKVGLTTHVSGILPGANGGTNNGFMNFTGPTTATKTFTLPNASATILTSNSAVTVAQGGTGIASGTSGGIPYFSGSTTIASSAALTANAIVKGGGSGSAPVASGVSINGSNYVSGAAGFNSALTETDAAFSGGFADAFTNGLFTTTLQPSSNSYTTIKSALTGEVIVNSSNSGDSGSSVHQVGAFGRVDNTGTGNPHALYGVEGRCDTTGTGAEDSSQTTLCTSFVASVGPDTGSAGYIGIYAGYYIGDNTDQGNLGTTFSLFSDDPDYTLRNDGPGIFNGKLTLANGQEAAGVATQAAARYLGPMGANDIGALGAGGVAMTAGQMYCTKVKVPKAGTLDSAQAEVITDGGGDIRFCGYNDTAGIPAGAPLYDATNTVSSTGVKTSSISTAVQAGEIWACIAVQTSGLTIDFDIVTNYHELYGLDSSRTAGQAAALATGVTGACPTNPSAAVTGTSTLTPGLGLSMN